MNKISIDFKKFTQEINVINGMQLSHVDSYYKKIDLHFGQYREDNELLSGDYVLYVSGFWEVLKDDQPILNETYSLGEITDFFTSHIDEPVTAVYFVENSLELFIELSSKYILHFKSDTDGHWIELLKRNGELVAPNSDKTYSHLFPEIK